MGCSTCFKGEKQSTPLVSTWDSTAATYLTEPESFAGMPVEHREPGAIDYYNGSSWHSPFFHDVQPEYPMNSFSLTKPKPESRFHTYETIFLIGAVIGVLYLVTV